MSCTIIDACKALLIAMLAAHSFDAHAQDYPDRPIRFVIPYPPGGASDITARILAPRLSDLLGKNVVTDNRGGANGIIGLSLVAKARPDGYTILMGNAGPNAMNPSIYKTLPYDPLNDFETVTLTAIVPQIAVVHPSINVSTVKELITLAKAKPGTLSYGSAGIGSSNHLSVELLKSMTGISLVHVPYKGTAPGMNDLVAGQIPIMFPTALSGMPFVKTGRLKAIGVTSAQRIPSLPDVPTIAEAGVSGYEASSWGGIMVPAKTPKSIISKLHVVTVKALALPEVKERLIGLGADVKTSTPEEFKAYLRAEIDKWRKVARFANISVDSEQP
ncbi:MAG: tripartite tricarboxylate transporter substrate binding protein [Betaproteobacteria bacterium]|nr:tripartite tricarboxylate transporter substrate binding protein [Betaproteobacteria bacterium]